MRFTLDVRGDWRKTEQSLKRLERLEIASVLRKQADRGVRALAAATPVDTALASSSWGHRIEMSGNGATIWWTNHNVEGGFPVAIMLQYGYGTGTGGYVAGRDYINPAMRPVFDRIADEVWKAVKKA